jgi:hypothetical protein
MMQQPWVTFPIAHEHPPPYGAASERANEQAVAVASGERPLAPMVRLVELRQRKSFCNIAEYTPVRGGSDAPEDATARNDALDFASPRPRAR